MKVFFIIFRFQNFNASIINRPESLNSIFIRVTETLTAPYVDTNICDEFVNTLGLPPIPSTIRGLDTNILEVWYRRGSEMTNTLPPVID